MTSREIVRTSLTLGVVWITTSAIASIPSSIGGLFASLGFSKPSPREFVEFLLIGVPFSLAVAAVFGLLPAWFLYTARERLTSKMVNESQADIDLQSSFLFGAAMIVLGVSYFVDGVAQVIAATASLILRFYHSSPMPWSTSDLPTSGLVYIAAGVLAYKYGTRAVLRAA